MYFESRELINNQTDTIFNLEFLLSINFTSSVHFGTTNFNVLIKIHKRR